MLTVKITLMVESRLQYRLEKMPERLTVSNPHCDMARLPSTGTDHTERICTDRQHAITSHFTIHTSCVLSIFTAHYFGIYKYNEITKNATYALMTTCLTTVSTTEMQTLPHWQVLLMYWHCRAGIKAATPSPMSPVVDQKTTVPANDFPWFGSVLWVSVIALTLLVEPVQLIPSGSLQEQVELVNRSSREETANKTCISLEYTYTHRNTFTPRRTHARFAHRF